MSALRRVLFVDDEPMVLHGLRRSMHSLRSQWTCEFVESGAEALQRMAGMRFDVIVSDMMMPGMNGAELLTEVRSRHPCTVRFVLSGQADPGLVGRCLNCAHRFLDKPCEFDDLNAALECATSLAFALQDGSLASLVAKIDRLPSPPRLRTELERRLRSRSSSVEEIGGLIGRDVAMTAQVLRLVNSAYFGLARELETAQEAVAYLGVETISSLALCLDLNDQMRRLGVTPASIEKLWDHSLKVSLAAKLIATEAGAGPHVVKAAATGGLLHDTGKLILALNFPNEVRRISAVAMEEGRTLSEVEWAQLGGSHAEVGGYLFALWGLPLSVVQAVAWHHQPEREQEETFSPTTAVHLADGLTHYLFKESEGGANPVLAEGYLRTRNVWSRVPEWQERLAAMWKLG